MNKYSHSAKLLRQMRALALSKQMRRPGKLDARGGLGRALRFVSLARLAALFASAGVMTTSLPAVAQAEPAPPPEANSTALPPPAQTSPEAGEPLPEDPPEAVAEGDLAEVVVTGFRVSLGAALLRKQRATGQLDAIVADDIADFPDLNLAEALQRLPGISITRSNGEGAQITVRGLTGLYTRVRVNGMETRAAIGSNAGRNFDFNVFASELFNSVVVHKTASADLDEGSLGAVVDLNTARAFNYDEGFTVLAGATGVYNDLSDTVRPRLTGLVAYRDPGGVWGATASAAYSSARNDSDGSDSVGFQRGAFNSVGGVPCVSDVTMETDPNCAAVSDAFHPRIPGYGETIFIAKRLGVTAGIQLRPTDQTELRLDGLYASFDTITDTRGLGVLFRGNEPGIDIINYQIREFPTRYGVTNNTLFGATVDNAFVRAGAHMDRLKSDFYQLTLALDHRFSDSFHVNALGGTTRSKGRRNDAFSFYDIRDYDGYSFDYTNDDYPSLVYGGADISDPTTYHVNELRDRFYRTTSGFDTAELDLHYDFFEELGLVAGANYKRATLDTKGWDRSGSVCGLELFNCDADGDGVDELLGPPGQAGLTNSIQYDGKVGAGSNTRWASPNTDAWFDYLDYRNKVPLAVDQDSTYNVTEKNLGYYLQARGEVTLGVADMRLSYDAGVRYVETRQSSRGYNSGVYVDIERPKYSDWLPSVNAALWLTEQVVVRFAAAEVMSRPALASLSPGGVVDSGDYTVSNQNPFLNPTRATALDAAAEWYFAGDSVLSLALFYKDIESFPIRESRTGTFASTGLPRAVIQLTSPADLSGPGAEGTCGNPEGCWQISELTDGPGAILKGLEVGFQAPLTAFYSHLPPILDALGVVANYTLVDSSVDYDFSGTTITERLIGLSNHSYNATVYYEDSKFGARLSLAYRSDYLLAGPAVMGNLWSYSEPETRLDFSSSYTVNEHLKFSLEALNLLDTPVSTRTDTDAERRAAYGHTGRNFLVGARLSF